MGCQDCSCTASQRNAQLLTSVTSAAADLHSKTNVHDPRPLKFKILHQPALQPYNHRTQYITSSAGIADKQLNNCLLQP
jgi:hypothetical protein